MSDTRYITHSQSGVTLYVVLRDRENGQMWLPDDPDAYDDGTMTAYVPANWNTYAMNVTETPTGGYVWPFRCPTNLPGTGATPRSYDREAYQRYGASRSLTDSPPVEREIIWWDGENQMTESEYAAAVAATATAGGGDDGISGPSPGAS